MTEIAGYEDTTARRRPDLLDAETDSWIAAIAEVAQLAAYLCDTTFVPAGLRGSAPATAATILYGREIGIPPITALQTMHVINGRVGMAAELMRARVLAAGHDLEVVESTAAVCRMRGRRRGSETWTTVGWSISDARQAGLGGDGWKKYPRAMLVARASAELCRLVFPDVTHGMAALEEIDAGAGGDTPTEPTPATPTRRVARAPRTAAPPTPPPEEEAGAGHDPHPPPVVVPTPAPRVVSETPPPEDGGSVVRDTPRTPANPPPVVVPPPTPATPPPPLPDPPPLPLPEPAPAPPMPAEDPDADPRTHANIAGDDPATAAQVRHVMVLFRRLGLGTTRVERLRVGSALVARHLATFNDLTKSDASAILTTCLLALDSDNPRQFIRWVVDENTRTMDDRAAAAEVADE